MLTSSARLCEVLNLDPSIRLHPTDAWITPQPIVPDPIPVSELIALALPSRPELGERRAAIRETLLILEGAKVLPFSPTVFIGFAAGGMGGGSNLVRPIFGGFGGRSDLDAYAFWTLQNLGVGNPAQINLARSRVGITRYQEIAVLDRSGPRSLRPMPGLMRGSPRSARPSRRFAAGPRAFARTSLDWKERSACRSSCSTA